jgi:hypothetical protein
MTFADMSGASFINSDDLVASILLIQMFIELYPRGSMSQVVLWWSYHATRILNVKS